MEFVLVLFGFVGLYWIFFVCDFWLNGWFIIVVLLAFVVAFIVLIVVVVCCY